MTSALRKLFKLISALIKVDVDGQLVTGMSASFVRRSRFSGHERGQLGDFFDGDLAIWCRNPRQILADFVGGRDRSAVKR